MKSVIKIQTFQLIKKIQQKYAGHFSRFRYNWNRLICKADKPSGWPGFCGGFILLRCYEAHHKITCTSLLAFAALLLSGTLSIFSFPRTIITALSLLQPTLTFPLSPHECKQSASKGLVAKLGNLAVFIEWGLKFFVSPMVTFIYKCLVCCTNMLTFKSYHLAARTSHLHIRQVHDYMH